MFTDKDPLKQKEIVKIENKVEIHVESYEKLKTLFEQEMKKNHELETFIKIQKQEIE